MEECSKLSGNIQRIYSDLGVKQNILRKIVKAHNDVLKYGIDTGNERVIVLDIKTEKIIADEEGTATRVIWRMNSSYKGKLIVIHNHPNNTHFSPKDLYSFSIVNQINIISVQAHDGNIYLLKKTTNTLFSYTEDVLKGVLKGIRQKYRDKSIAEQGEIFVKHIANIMKWDFVKGGECDGK